MPKRPQKIASRRDLILWKRDGTWTAGLVVSVNLKGVAFRARRPVFRGAWVTESLPTTVDRYIASAAEFGGQDVESIVRGAPVFETARAAFDYFSSYRVAAAS